MRAGKSGAGILQSRVESADGTARMRPSREVHGVRLYDEQVWTSDYSEHTCSWSRDFVVLLFSKILFGMRDEIMELFQFWPTQQLL